MINRTVASSNMKVCLIYFIFISTYTVRYIQEQRFFVKNHKNSLTTKIEKSLVWNFHIYFGKVFEFPNYIIYHFVHCHLSFVELKLFIHSLLWNKKIGWNLPQVIFFVSEIFILFYYKFLVNLFLLATSWVQFVTLF